MKDPRSALPWLWVFMLVNFLYCDVVTLFDPAILRNTLADHPAPGSVQMTPEALLAAALLMEVPMAMMVLSRVLARRPSRWLNVGAAAVLTVAQAGSLTVGSPAAYYLFFSAIEIGTLVVIAALALRWRAAPHLGTGAVQPL